MINKPNIDYKDQLPILSVLNREINGVIRWCTPSIHPRVPKATGIYDNDISVSYHSLGNPSLRTGIFKKAYDLAAKTYKSDQTLFCVNGSTGCNFIVLRALAHQFKEVNILAQRNVHKSISVGIEDYKINVNYLEPHYDQRLQIFVPNTIEEFEKGLIKNPETNVLFISNPTYEGLSLNLPELIKRVRKINSGIIVFIDEAWGSLFSFSDKMPTSAMEAGADICVQSTHKQGSGLQQSSMIHWKGKRVKEKYIMDSYKSLSTTSPSFHLLASLDGARYLMETQGEEIINYLLEVASLLRKGLDEIQGVEVIKPNKLKESYSQIGFLDESKVLVNVKQTGLAGYEIARHLEKDYKIIVEKYEANNIVFLTTFQNNKFEVGKTIESFKYALQDLKNKKKSKKLPFPKFPTKIIRRIPSYSVAGKKTKEENLKNAVGKVCAEDIVPYPPGIPLIAKGEEIQRKHTDYLIALRELKGAISVVVNDTKISKIITIDE